jgi:peptide/nickel transport system substrate-binding protein
MTLITFARGLALGLALLFTALPARAETVLRAVMHSDLKILDPVWTAANITRNHGYMIYDTLFAYDGKGEVQPQMVDRYEVSADNKTYSFVVRDGLLWHDGQPVTAEDCVASLKRWAVKDAAGQLLMRYVEDLSPVDERTFKMVLKQPVSIVLPSLAKRSGLPAFMMPKRVAATDPNKQFDDFTGSGPFMLKRDEWKPGNMTVYVKFAGYKPRSEPPSGLAGGKVVKVDRVEWRAISDYNQAVSALLAGEIDYIEQPPIDLLPLVKDNPDIKIWNWNPYGNQFMFRPNHTQPPFDNPKVRQALWYAFNQDDFMKAVLGDPEFYKGCLSFFACGTEFENSKIFEGKLNSNFAKARELLKEAGYDGATVVLLHSTDLFQLTNLAPVAKTLLERAGFKVDMQSMDWQTVVARRAKKDPPTAGGWSAFMTSNTATDVTDPVMAQWIASTCDKAYPGWPCDAEIEKLRDAFLLEIDPAKQKAISDAVQERIFINTPLVHLGQWYNAAPARKTITGILPAGIPVFWNVEKK